MIVAPFVSGQENSAISAVVARINNEATLASFHTDRMISDSVIDRNRRTIRVDAGKLQTLSRLVDQLNVAVAQVALVQDSNSGDSESDPLAHCINQMITVAQEIRDAVDSLSRATLLTTFRRAKRLVRDNAMDAGKRVDLEINADDIEMDKREVDLIDDSLMHAIRNAVDHGLEAPDERERAGKSPVGRITVEARVVEREVLISISDDGRGLDREKILKRAREMSLLTGSGADLPDPEIWRLIFLPGFSTANRITKVSGRGVGMEVIRENMAKLNGGVEVQSQLGKGTTIVLRIPGV